MLETPSSSKKSADVIVMVSGLAMTVKMRDIHRVVKKRKQQK